jgi:hypothetical protein
MKLVKALKLKNKQVQAFNSTVSRMIKSNSYDEDSNKVYNSKELLIQATKELEDLVKLKSAIHSSSEPIRNKIFRLSEFKSFVQNISNLNTTEGVVKASTYGSSTNNTYKCDINEIEKQDLIKTFQDEIEKMQDEIDVFNATTDLKGY